MYQRIITYAIVALAVLYFFAQLYKQILKYTQQKKDNKTVCTNCNSNCELKDFNIQQNISPEEDCSTK